MSLTVCDGYKLARHAPITFDNDGSFCPACEAIEEKQALQDDLDETKAMLDEARRELAAHLAETHRPRMPQTI